MRVAEVRRFGSDHPDPSPPSFDIFIDYILISPLRLRLRLFYPVIVSMATSSVSIPRFLLPRANYLLRPRSRLLPPTSNSHSALVRHASNSQPSSSKPLVLEKPAKFNPPSHGAHLPRKKPRNYGPALTEQQKHEMKTKKYPSMMPPEGSFMHWFLTNRWLHTWISLVCFLVVLYQCSVVFHPIPAAMQEILQNSMAYN